MHTLLQIGDDRRLMSSRGFILQRAGLEVTSSHSARAGSLLDSFFDLILLCHTVPYTDVDQMRRYTSLFWPVTRVIRLAFESEMHASPCGSLAYFPREEGPGALVRFVASLLAAQREIYAPASVTASGKILQMKPEARRQLAVPRRSGESDQLASAP